MTGKEKELNEEQLKKAAGGSHGDAEDRDPRDRDGDREVSDRELGDAHGAGGDLSKGPADREESEEEH